MDIAQSVAPLMIDPQSLQTTITTSLEIPLENVTPTITKVRGESIDFRYYVEVCLDLHGKLENARYLPRLTAQPLHGFGKPSAGGGASVPLSLAAQGAHFIDTQLIRRERTTTIAWTFHVVVGTRDSNRKATPNRQRDGRQVGDGPLLVSQGGANGVRDGQAGAIYLGDVQEEWDRNQTVELGQVLANGVDQNGNVDQVHEIGRGGGHDPTWNHSSSNLSSVPTEPTPPPPPAMPQLPPSMSAMDEKARMRQQEEWLLPSAPPMDDMAGSSGAAAVPLVPSAYVVDGSHATRWEPEIGARVRDSGGSYAGSDPAHREHTRPQMQHRHSHSSHFSPSEEGDQAHCTCGALRSPGHRDSRPEWADSTDSLPLPQQSDRHRSATREAVGATSQAPSIHSFGTRSAGSARTPGRAATDKQELERQRLLLEQSAPQYGDPDEPASLSSRANVPVPSVPTLGDLREDDEPQAQHTAFGEWDRRHDELPRYER